MLYIVVSGLCRIAALFTARREWRVLERAMVVKSIVDAYSSAAMAQAQVEMLDDGTVAATIPAAFGVIAFGADRHECAAELQRRLWDWVCSWSAAGHSLPVIDGIDLNTEAARALISCHAPPASGTNIRFFDNDEEFDADLAGSTGKRS